MTAMATFFEELQAMDETMKKRVLVISTIVIMIVVVAIWAAYFNSIVLGGSSSQQSADTGNVPAAPAPVVSLSANPAPPAPAGPSIWQRIENGVGSFFATLARPIEYVFKNPANYTIQPQQ